MRPKSCAAPVRLTAWLLGMIVLAASMAPAHAARLALVIGNDAYQKVSSLQKAGSDASAMARELRGAGFQVTLRHNLNYLEMVNAIEVFASQITGGDQVVVFFAGHGVQIKTGSYLLPVDITANSESQVEKTSYGVADLTDKLGEAKAAFALVIVDACRDNPLKSNGRSIGGIRGLSAIEPPKGQMVVYSASKGQQALDKLNEGDSNPNGVFTREFIKRMKQPGVRIEDMMRDVQDAVETLALSVSHEQRPAIYNESRGNFYFFGPASVQVPGQSGAMADPESEAWTAAERSNSVAGMQAYLQAYPNGRYLVAAKIALATLNQGTAQSIATPNKTTPSASDDPESQLWNQVKSNGDRAYLDAYLEQYPKGRYVALARIELKKLDDQDSVRQSLAQQQQDALRVQREQERIATSADGRFVLTNAGTVRDLRTALEWSQSDNGAEIRVGDAMNYCGNKGQGWRLPTVAELTGIYDPAQKVSCGWSFILPISCRMSSAFRLTGHTFWSSDSERGSSRPLSVLMENGEPRRARADRAEDQRALCVRRP